MAKRNQAFTRWLSALLAAGMLAGMMPAAAWAEDADPAATAAQTVEATPETAEGNVAVETDETPAGETADEAADEMADEAANDEQLDGETTLTVSTDDFVTYSIGESTDETALCSAQLMLAGVEVQNAPTISVAKLPLDETTGKVFGAGIKTGTGELFDTETWDKQSANRGCDSGADNDVVRSFDSVIYTVTTTLTGLDADSDTHTLTYEFTLPTDTELTMSASTDPKQVSFMTTPNTDGTTTYAYTFSVSTDEGVGGEVNRDFPLSVGNKSNGYTFEPKITVHLDNDETTRQEVQNNAPIYVTSVPAYNIVLDKNTGLSNDLAKHDFANSKTESCKNLAKAFDYADNTVIGYRQFYGFSLEMAHPGRGIRGTEFPDLTQNITFDIDISGYTVTNPDKSKTLNVSGEGFTPLLYEINFNEGGSANIGKTPYTKPHTDANGTQWGCYDCGDVKNVKIEQDTKDPATLHVTLPANTIRIDTTQFPQKNQAGETYWAALDKILRGVFASWRFTVIYPYQNAAGKTLMDDDLFPTGGGIAVKAIAKNMDIVSSADGAHVTQETTDADNTAERTWSVASKGSREHGIFYSQPMKTDTSYSAGAKGSDSDVAAVGANDLAFTVLYSQTQVGEVYPNNTPKRLEQLVLFDSNAIQNVRLGRNNADDRGYTLTLKYARYNGDALNNDTMRTADKDNFTYYDSVDEIPDDRYDGVLLVYEGNVKSGISDLNLTAQCTAQVSPNATPGAVYMITLITDATAQAGNAMDRIDHRQNYDIPVYNDGQYSAGEGGHNFSTAYADGLYIVPYLAEVTKNVAQKDTDGSDYSDYDFSQGQRYVDYCIAPSLNYKTQVTLPEGASTTVTLVDTLPKGMEYIDGSARWGGSYTDLGPTISGIITGGEAIEPDKSVNGDGLTVLTWTIKNVPLGQTVPKLYYSCKLGDELDPNKDNELDYVNGLTNFVGIHTTEDQRPFAIESKNYSSAKVTPYKANQFFISKRGEPWKELNGNAYYDLTISNTSATDKKDLVVVDAMPYDGKNNTTKKGSYKLSSLTLNLKALNGDEDFAVWYTEDSSKAGLVSTAFDKNELAQADSVWKKLDYEVVTAADGSKTAQFKLPADGIWPTAIVYLDENLVQYTVARLHMEFDIVGAVGDDLVNVMTTPSNNENIPATAETRIVSRSLEGTVWYDKDQDGKIGKDEERLQGVNATLLRKNENGEWEKAQLFVDPATGERYPSTVTTDENGHYKFVGLPEGEYRVAFTDGNGNVLGQYDAETKFDASADGSKVKNDNDSVTKNRDNKLKSGTINDIDKAPTLEEIAGGQYSGGWEKTGDADYNMPNQNFGVIKNSDTPKEPDKPANSPTPEPDKPTNSPTPTPENPGTPTPTPAAPTATPVTPTATPKPGTPDSPVTPVKPANPTTPAQSTATPSPAPAATPQAAKATATPAPAATAAIPQTGDSMPVGMLLAMAVLALGSAAVLTVVKRRKEK